MKKLFVILAALTLVLGLAGTAGLAGAAGFAEQGSELSREAAAHGLGQAAPRRAPVAGRDLRLASRASWPRSRPMRASSTTPTRTSATPVAPYLSCTRIWKKSVPRLPSIAS